jgi:hypothetical protein
MEAPLTLLQSPTFTSPFHPCVGQLQISRLAYTMALSWTCCWKPFLQKQGLIKVVFLKPWGFEICEILPSCGFHESQSLTILGKLPYSLLNNRTSFRFNKILDGFLKTQSMERMMFEVLEIIYWSNYHSYFQEGSYSMSQEHWVVGHEHSPLISVFPSGDKASFVASWSSSLQKYTNVPNSHLLQN